MGSVNWRISIALWILFFLTFVAAMSTIKASIVWAINGTDSSVPLYVIGNLMPSWSSMPVTTYFWLSLDSTFILFGVLIIVVLQRPRLAPELHRMVYKVEDQMEATRATMDGSRASLLAKMEDEKIARQDMLTSLNAHIGTTRKELFDELEKQRNAIAKALQDLEELAKQAGNQRKEALDARNKEMRSIRAIENFSRRTAAIAEKNNAEIANLEARLMRLQSELVPPKPKLRSTSRTEEVKGIGSKLSEELKTIGITNVGELLLTDPKSIVAGTKVTPEMVTRLQFRAQLLMIPGIDESDAEILLDSGVASKNDLATQDPVELGRKLDTIASRYIEEGKISASEKPTFEEISAWIRLAKL